MWDQVREALNQSMIRVLDQLAGILPGFVALIVAVVFASAIAWGVAYLARRVLRSLKFDERLIGWGMPTRDWSPSLSPSVLLSSLIFWLIVFAGFLVGVAAFDTTLTAQLMFQFVGYLPTLVIAVVILLAGNLIARFVSRSVLIGAVNMNLQYATLLATGVKWMIMVLAVAMALDHLAIAQDIVHLAFGLLFGGIVLALVLAVGLGSKELVSRSLERDARKKSAEAAEPFRHL